MATQRLERRASDSSNSRPIMFKLPQTVLINEMIQTSGFAELARILL
jgi:hypothetical protein